MVQNGPNDHFGQNGLIPNWILAFARPKWSILVYFGLKRSILVHFHSGPPTVLWPFLIQEMQSPSVVATSHHNQTSQCIDGTFKHGDLVLATVNIGNLPRATATTSAFISGCSGCPIEGTFSTVADRSATTQAQLPLYPKLLPN